MKGLEVGCNDYMTKPVSKHELLARIATQLRVQSVWRLEMERDVHEQVPCLFGGSRLAISSLASSPAASRWEALDAA